MSGQVLETGGCRLVLTGTEEVSPEYYIDKHDPYNLYPTFVLLEAFTLPYVAPTMSSAKEKARSEEDLKLHSTLGSNLPIEKPSPAIATPSSRRNLVRPHTIPKRKIHKGRMEQSTRLRKPVAHIPGSRGAPPSPTQSDRPPKETR